MHAIGLGGSMHKASVQPLVITKFSSFLIPFFFSKIFYMNAVKALAIEVALGRWSLFQIFPIFPFSVCSVSVSIFCLFCFCFHFLFVLFLRPHECLVTLSLGGNPIYQYWHTSLTSIIQAFFQTTKNIKVFHLCFIYVSSSLQALSTFLLSLKNCFMTKMYKMSE